MTDHDGRASASTVGKRSPQVKSTSEKVTDDTSALEALCAIAAVGSPAPKPSVFSVVANGPGQEDLGILVPIAEKAREQNATRVKALAPTSWHEKSAAVMMDLTTKEWIHPAGTEWIPWIEMPRSFAKNRLQSMPIKGRNSREEKQAEKKADEILRSSSWIVSSQTPFHIVEQLVLMLCVSLLPIAFTSFSYTCNVRATCRNGWINGLRWKARLGAGAWVVVSRPLMLAAMQTGGPR